MRRKGKEMNEHLFEQFQQSELEMLTEDWTKFHPIFPTEDQIWEDKSKDEDLTELK